MENYKEKYEQALGRARVWKEKSGMPVDRQGILDDIFPELKESEDEKIRKEIIEFICWAVDRGSITDKQRVKSNLWVAWLEKQGHTDSIIEKAKTEKQRVIITETDGNANIDWDTRSLEDARELLEYGLQYINTELEKQGEYDIDCPKNHQDSSRPNGCIVLEDFNGGDGFYKLNLDYLNKRQVEEVEEMVRTWNKESKTSNENIKNCIGMCLTDASEQRFKDYNTNLKDCLAWLENPQKYWLEKQGEQKPEELPKGEDYGIDGLWHAQRILEKTLGEVEGYQSDDGILEHKCAIEAVNRLYKQKPAWSEEDKGNLLDVKCIIDEVWHNQNVREEIDHSGEELESLWHWLDNIWQKVAYPESPLKQTAWSEEDEKHYQGCLNLMKLSLDTKPYPYYNDYLWLKSLKDRIQPQPKQEWSEEDWKYYHKLEMFLEVNEHYSKTEKSSGYQKDVHETLSWLKSLRPNKYVTWSEEDEVMVEDIIEAIDTQYAVSDYNEMVDWLKSLKERYTWKPSDEQIEALLKLEEMHVLEHEKNQENAHLYMVIKNIREQLQKLRKE